MPRDLRIGIDLGGTKIEGVVLAPPFDLPRIEERIRIATEARLGPDAIAARVLEVIRRLELRAGGPCPTGVGIPGSLTRDGRVQNSNLVCLNGTSFTGELSRRAGRELSFANDANCFAMAEARFGAGRGRELVVGLIMGTGVGGGIVIDGKVRAGPLSICGEWGHAVLRPGSERVCHCGRRGCVETYLAGPWIERDYRRRGGGDLSLREILRRRDTDAAAAGCARLWLDSYGLALGNLINSIDPDVVVLGGGVSNADCLYVEGRSMVARHVRSAAFDTPIVPNELGDSSGVLGAALLVV